MKLSFKQKIGIGLYMGRSLLTKPQCFAYNPRKQSFIDDPYPVYRHMRDEKPAFWSPHHWLASLARTNFYCSV
ncbi:MAG: hypothetical protein IPN27_00610 [Cellvibrionales bacterium]|nr:hypothetical protein [Cellvibrionales bacterium]